MNPEDWTNAIQGVADAFEDDNLPRRTRVFLMEVAPGEDPAEVRGRLDHRKEEAVKALPPDTLFSHLTAFWNGSAIVATLYAIKLPVTE